ncbi:MAG TPA: ribosomal protein S18-alanine N-acetyltransferase [Oligoflexia bacterium]|nr:ribosomal protein S18-alanine N-acetyltransferase [Oligoflexia bacterium]
MTQINTAQSALLCKHDYFPVQVIPLELPYFEDVCRLEQVCYSNPWSSELIRGEFQNQVSLRRAVVKNGELVGYSFNHLVEKELHILNLAVAPRYRRCGFGRLVLGRVIQESMLFGACMATLEVRRSNVIAQQLYFSFGFERVGVRHDYYRDNHEDALVLELRLGTKL